MTALSELLLNPLLHYVIWGGFWVYCIRHQYSAARVIQQHGLDISFGDRLLLFVLPIWSTEKPVNAVAALEAKRLARQFMIVFSLLLFLYLAMAAVFLV